MKITVEDIKEILKTDVEVRLDLDLIELNEPLTDQGMDSLEGLTLFLTIEEKYGVKVEEDEMDGLQSVNEIIEFVNAKL